jgi:drug/metabolite transporter (DMT)-like permease
MQNKTSSRLTAIGQALLVVFLWATSWVLIKIGLQDMPPVIFAGLRYSLAFLILLALVLVRDPRRGIASLPKRMWARLAVLGLLQYAVTQGAVFVSLAYLPGVTANLLWSFTTVLVTLLGIGWLSERPSLLQWSGMLLALVGALVYFYPVAIPAAQIFGVLAVLVGISSNAVAAILGRAVNRSHQYRPLHVTAISMGVGGLALLVTGLLAEGMPPISLRSGAIILWLAGVNTAFAFTLWNQTQRTLTAMESSIINGTMLIWIPILAVLFLGEHITGRQMIGLVLAGLGVLVVQLRRVPRAEPAAPSRPV